ncbi:30S ribosomal protein S17 [Candidatus Azambacteria bacterium]|nr:30S ribosomal protein S17 [Candidatus Azambacteria bacterium]
MENKTVQKRILEGVVVSDKMDKTVVVLVSEYKKHKTYNKYHMVSKRFKAHDEKNEFKVGDKVRIQETRPISKDKKWIVLK